MSSERFFMEISSPTGRIVRLGDKFVNQQGIELAVSKLYRPLDSEDILVEFTPVDAALSGGSWCNELLMDCEEPFVLSDRAYSRRFPWIPLDRLYKLQALEDILMGKKIGALEYAASSRYTDHESPSVRVL